MIMMKYNESIWSKISTAIFIIGVVIANLVLATYVAVFTLNMLEGCCGLVKALLFPPIWFVIFAMGCGVISISLLLIWSWVQDVFEDLFSRKD